MLSTEDNELLCRVGPGTRMGNLLRRYWMPALLSEEIPEPDSPPVRVKLLGEEMVAFRDTDGKVGLLDNYCPHRRASLFFGRNEECGLRCVYHGWKFDVNGACVDMPSEPAESNFKDKVKITAYPTVERGGAVYAYMGPPALQPPFLTFQALSYPDNHMMANRMFSSCNYMQALEGNIDSSHVGFLHAAWENLLAPVNPETDVVGVPAYTAPSDPNTPTSIGFRTRGFSRAPMVQVQDTPYGFRYAGIRETPAGHKHIRVTTVIFLIYQMVARLPGERPGYSAFVPIDDESCYRWNFNANPDRPYTDEERSSIRRGNAQRDESGNQIRGMWNDYLINRDAQRSATYTGIVGIQTQDLAVTESMGAVTDRSREHLGGTDSAIIKFRRMLINAARDMMEGIDPPMPDPSIVVKVRSHEEIIPGGADWRLYGAYAGEDAGVKA